MMIILNLKDGKTITRGGVLSILKVATTGLTYLYNSDHSLVKNSSGTPISIGV